MTRPTSRLVWTPDRDDARTIRAQWIGAGWHYTIYWGDGTHDDRLFWQGPISHQYPKSGTYDLVCISSLNSENTISGKVTVRDFTSPPTPGSSLDGNTVTLTMPPVADPVRWRVAWGDDTTSEHGAGETPSTTYPWSFGTPRITVWDLPSKRAVQFDGPQIGPEPPGPDGPVRGFFVEFVSKTGDHRRYRLRGGGVTPGATITWYPWSCAWYRDVVADQDGKVTDEIDVPHAVNADFDDSWRSYTVKHEGRVTFLPVHGPIMEARKPAVTYQVHHDGKPGAVLLSATPAQYGTHVVDFGDGSATATVPVDELPLQVPHTYTGTGPYAVTITLPDGRKATGNVRNAFPCPSKPCFNHYYPGSCTVTWLFNGWPEHNCPSGGVRGSDAFAPVVIDNGYHPVHQIHRPDNRDGWHVAYGYGLPVGKYTFRYTTALTAPTDNPINIAKAAPVKKPYTVEVVELRGDDPVITAWFGDVTEWDGGYSGKFHVHNAGQEATSWEIEFNLQAPAVLRDVWPRSVKFAEVAEGSGRWRIWSNTPLAGGTDAIAGARVEPPGKTRKFPDEIQGKPWTPPSEEGGTSERT